MSNTPVGDNGTLPLSPTSAAENGKRITRRRLLRTWGGITTVGAAGGALAYGGLYAPFHPVVERVTVPIRHLPPSFANLRVALLSDLHVQPGFPAKHLAPAVAIVQREQPDLILLLGDYISDQEPDKLYHLTQCIRAIRSLKAPLGVYAIFGNHDFPPPPDDPIREPWTEAGIRPLCNEIGVVTRGKDAIYLCGMRSGLARPVYPGDLLGTIPPDSAQIVLWHEPDRAPDLAGFGASLMLSGHTHGGQVVIPGLRPPILPLGGKLFPSGLFPIRPTFPGGALPSVPAMPLYVTRGVGLLPPLIRINCPPEVTIMTWVPA